MQVASSIRRVGWGVVAAAMVCASLLAPGVRLASAAATPVKVGIGSASVVEGDTGSRRVLFAVTLSRVTTGVVTVHYATQSGTAVAGSDFAAKSGTVAFAPGATSAAVSVLVRGNAVANAPLRSFTVRLSAPVGASLDRATATGTILDDDATPARRISVGSPTVLGGNDATRVWFSVTLSQPSASAVSAHFATAAGSAHDGTDFVGKSGTVMIPAGGTDASIAVRITGRPGQWEGPTQKFTMALSVPAGASLYQPVGTATIRHDGPTKFVQTSGGVAPTCALSQIGSVKCWGSSNSVGQLGNGSSSANAGKPVQVKGMTSGVRQISVASIGGEYACAITGARAVKCWGNNSYGKLGNNQPGVNSSVPVQVVGLTSGVAQISVGAFNACAVTTSGSAKCWGRNNSGALGNGSTTQSAVPVQVTGLTSGVTQISVGILTTCAVTAGGAAKCWGSAANGTLGNGSTTESHVPVQVTGLTSGVAQVSNRSYGGSCALTTGGAVKCWGLYDFGQIGDGTSGSSPPFKGVTQVQGLTSGVTQIAGGERFTCALLAGGLEKCWGSNVWGQLGGGSSETNKSVPTLVSGLTSGVTRIAAGAESTCAITDGGATVKCWGRILGNGNAAYLPTTVLP